MREVWERLEAIGPAHAMDRRQFLRWAVCGVAAAAVPGIVGCGGGGGGAVQPSGGGMSPAERAAAMDAIQSKAMTLDLRNKAASNQAMLAYLQGRAEFAQSGLTANGVVWAKFKDGALYRFINNRHPDGTQPTLAAKRASRAPDDSMPKNARIYSLHGLGTYLSSTTEEVRAMLLQAGYTEPIGAGGLATLEALRNVKQAGVFYLSTHGGDGDEGFCFTTCTKVTDALEKDATVQQEVKDHLLTYCGVVLDSYLGGLFGGSVAHVYGFTNKFVEKYMTFAPNSFVFIDACTSDDLLMKDACFKEGASVYAGWTAPVRNGVSIKASEYVFDRLLGANTATPKEDPAQRPFDYASVWEDMKKKGLDTSPGDGEGDAKLIFSASGLSSEFGLLNPSIQQMDVDEVSDQLVLRGIFGHDQGTVTINQATDLAIVSWAPGKVVCTLPRTGPSSVGNVQVTVRGHKSNVRQITEWKLNIRYKWTDDGRPGLIVQGPVTIRFRADVGDYRVKPGEAPQQPTRTAYATRESQTLQSASGTYTDAQCVTKWSGTRLFTPGEFEQDPTSVLLTRFKIDTKTRTGYLALAYGDVNGGMFTETMTCPDNNTSFMFAIAFGLLDAQPAFEDPMGRPNVPAIPLPALKLTFDTDYAIAARTFVGETHQAHIEWDRTPANYPPDPQAGRAATGGAR